MKFLTKLFLENSIVRVSAVLLILYFGVYKYDKSPDSLAKRLNQDTISKNYNDIKNGTVKIFNTIAYKKSITAKREESPVVNADLSLTKQRINILKDQISKIDSLDKEYLVKVDNGKNGAGCRDEVVFSYDLIDAKEKKNLFSKKNRSIKIADQEVIMFERLLAKMFKKEVKEVLIDRDYNFLPSIVRKYYLSSEGVIFVRLTLNEVKKSELGNQKPTEIEKLICK